MTEKYSMIGKFCVVRTCSAGVFSGTLLEREGTRVVLRDARKIWQWTSNNCDEKVYTVQEFSQLGAGNRSRLSRSVPLQELTEAIEIIPCSERAADDLQKSRWS